MAIRSPIRNILPIQSTFPVMLHGKLACVSTSTQNSFSLWLQCRAIRIPGARHILPIQSTFPVMFHGKLACVSTSTQTPSLFGCSAVLSASQGARRWLAGEACTWASSAALAASM
eukprot:1160554-Prymnesium_polylepis.1